MAARQTESLHLPLPAGAFLQGTFSYSDQPGPAAILYVHGFGSVRGGAKAAAFEAACARRGWTFAAFDFRGHGDSSGTLLELRGSGLQADLDQAQAYLMGRGIRQLFPVGSSMGGWATAWFVTRHPGLVPACVAIAPAFNFPRSHWAKLSETQRRAWRQTGRLPVRNAYLDVEVGYGLVEEINQFPVERLAAAWTKPLLIFHGMQDDSVPYQESLAFVQMAAGTELELRLYRDGDHRLLARKDEMAEAACRFFERWWPPSG
jgi:alpha-beta hydrolase superfamily lysophospholipase